MKKTLTMVLAFALVFALGVGGTLAWLTSETTEVKNTFTIGDINITLTETDAVNGEKNYDFVPGDTHGKDPKVTVVENSEACWLFVKVVENNNTRTDLEGKIINWTIAGGWTETSTGSGIYYRQVDETTAKAGVEYPVLLNNQVTVNQNVTKAMRNEIFASKPTLTFDAAAVQSEHITNMTDALAQVVWSN